MPQSARAPQLLSRWSRAWGCQLLKPPRPRARALQQEKPRQSETHTPQPESSPHLLQLQQSPAAMKTHLSQK